jgi:hypothetical protein
VADDADLEAIGSELDALAERLGEAGFDSLRAQLRRPGRRGKVDRDLEREKLLQRARHAVERASMLVAKAVELGEAGAVGEAGAPEEDPGLSEGP